MAGVGNTSEHGIEAQARMVEALEMRKAGTPYSTIAEKLGFASHSGALKAVQRALKQTLKEPADDVRALELQRLDAMWEATWAAALRGIPRAVEVALKIMDRRANLLGLDAPSQHRFLLDQEAQRIAEQTGMTKAAVLAGVQDILQGRQ